jgi:hypothetical protein
MPGIEILTLRHDAGFAVQPAFHVIGLTRKNRARGKENGKANRF